MRGQLVVAVGILIVSGCSDPTGTQTVRDIEPAFAAGGAPFKPTGPQQPLIDTSRALWALFRPGEGQILAQTFTPDRNMVLGYLQLPATCAPGVLLNIKIRKGLGGAILEEFNYVAPVAPFPGFELFQVYNPATSRGIRLRRGTTYAFELAAFYLGAYDPGNNCAIAAGPARDTYAGGSGWDQSPINGPLFFAFPGGEDLPFITLVR